MYEYRCKIIRVVDGDTVDVDIDLGFDVWLRNQRIRLYGINTPEVRTRDIWEKEQGLASKKRLEELLDSVDNKFILISKGVGKYGRCLGELLIGEYGEVHINNLLLSEGLAEKYE